MKYLAIIYGNAELWASFSEEDTMAAISGQDAWNKKYFATGELLVAQGLADVAQAQTVRVRDGVVAVTDGPYLETKEYLASYYLFDVESHDRALELTAEVPFASTNAVELWPVLHEGLPDA